jgi:nudix-type nucleoside diphosphatase (YffH/AdpP family)
MHDIVSSMQDFVCYPEGERIRVKEVQVLSDDWYILKKTRFDRRRRDGTWQELTRETYDRGNGATILLYNIEKRTVILTRQFRYPAFVNGHNGMLIEAAAGLLDDASPEERIRAEAEEETGFRVYDVRRIFDAFMSPGSVTERLHFFVAIYTNDDRASDGGGQVAEGEDIEVLEMAIEEALAGIASGVIQDGKTIMLLQYAALHLFPEKKAVVAAGLSGLSGQAIGVYTLLSQIGQGGMGTVWLAERNDGRFERQVAVKFLNLALVGESGDERFRREGRILALLVHPNIAELIDAGVLPTGQPYLVLEHIEGDQIDRYCNQHQYDIRARIVLFLDVLAAVAHAHAGLVVHRDLKASNVLVRNDGQVKLVDFGIAQLLDVGETAGTTQLTIEGMRAMTPESAAPEQMLGQVTTTATDVYALGGLLYLLLTGEHPAGCSVHNAADFVKAIVEKEPKRPSVVVMADGGRAGQNAAERNVTPSRLSRMLRGDLESIVLKALKKDPAERYESVTAMAEDLRRYLNNERISVQPNQFSHRAARFVRRHGIAVRSGRDDKFDEGGIT